MRPTTSTRRLRKSPRFGFEAYGQQETLKVGVDGLRACVSVAGFWGLKTVRIAPSVVEDLVAVVAMHVAKFQLPHTQTATNHPTHVRAPTVEKTRLIGNR